jgi:hypothetical protein
MPRGKEAKRKLFAPPKKIVRKPAHAYGSGKVSTASKAVAAKSKQHARTLAPNVSLTTYMTNPNAKNNVKKATHVKKPVTHQAPKNLRRTTKGRLELKTRGYVVNASKKKKHLVNPSVVKKWAPTSRVVGQATNAKKPRAYVKGTAREREIRNDIYNMLGISPRSP